MQHHSDLSDAAFEAQLLQGQFPPKLFDHKAHLRLAWWYLQQYPTPVAAAKTSQCLQTYVAHLGATQKYHHTLTVAAVQVVAHFINKTGPVSFETLLQLHPRLATHFMELLHQHYSPDLLDAPQARQHYLAPDLLTFEIPPSL